MFPFVFLLSTNSFSQVNYKTDLLNFVWSINCNNINLPSYLFTESSNNVIMKHGFSEGQRSDSFSQTIKKIEGAGGPFLHVFFMDSRNRNGVDTIEIKNEGFRLIHRVIDGEYFFKSGRNLKTNLETTYLNRCSANSAVFIMVDNLYPNKNSVNQTNTNSANNTNTDLESKKTNSFRQACYGPDGNFKKIVYPDGSKAEVIKDGRSDKACACGIRVNSEKYEILSPQEFEYGKMPLEISNIYKNYSPFYGCPDYTDYSKIVQILKIRDAQETTAKAEAKKKEDDEIRIAAQNLVNMTQKFCKGIPKVQVNILEYIGDRFESNPDEVKLKRVQPKDNYLGCAAIFYTPRGPINCSVVFDNTGVINNINVWQLGCSRQ